MGDITPSWNPSADRRRNKKPTHYSTYSSTPSPEKPASGGLDDFIVPQNITPETCAKCHDAPTNEAWNIFCNKCSEEGLF